MAAQAAFHPSSFPTISSIATPISECAFQAWNMRREITGQTVAFLSGGIISALSEYPFLPLFGRFMFGGIAFLVTYYAETYIPLQDASRTNVFVRTFFGLLWGSQFGAAVITLAGYAVSLPNLALMVIGYPVCFFAFYAFAEIGDFCGRILAAGQGRIQQQVRV